MFLVDQMPFFVFILLCRPSEDSLRQNSSSFKDWQSSVCWWDCLIRTQRLQVFSLLSLPVSHPYSLWDTTTPIGPPLLYSPQATTTPHEQPLLQLGHHYCTPHKPPLLPMGHHFSPQATTMYSLWATTTSHKPPLLPMSHHYSPQATTTPHEPLLLPMSHLARRKKRLANCC